MTKFPLNEVFGKCTLLGLCFISLLRFPQTGAVIENQWTWDESRSAVEGTNVTLWWAFGLGDGETFSRASISFVLTSTSTHNIALIKQSGAKQIDAKYQSRVDITKERQNVSLILTNITLSDDGIYSCKVETSTDDLGKTKTTVFEVTVYPKIVFTNPINKTVVINESQPFSLFCNASGKPTPVLVWRKISGSPFVDFSDGSTGTLTVSSSSSQHNGTYQCTATNKAGSDTATFVVVVRYKPNSVRISPHALVTLNETGSTTLTCQASNGYPAEYWYKWQYNGNDISGGENENLILIDVQRNQTGNYSCQGCNTLGCTSNSTNLIVQYKPADASLLVQQGNNKVKWNTDVNLNCSLGDSGSPPVHSYTFYLDSQTLLVNQPTYTFPVTQNVNCSCLGRNTMGSSEKSNTLSLKVYDPPKVDLSVSAITIIEGDTVILTCSATGIPRPNVTWSRVLKNNSSESINQGVCTSICLKGYTNEPAFGERFHVKESLTLASVTDSIEGSYTCNGSSVEGRDSATHYIDVKDNPCKRSPCNNGGTCSVISSTGVVSYKCDCISTLWKGKDCNESICDGICKNGGICNRTDGKCSCNGFWIGETCEIASCERKPCYGGECKILGGSVNGECICPKEKRGTYCDLEIDNIKETGWEVKLSTVGYQKDYKNVKSIASQQLVLSFLPEIVNESNAEGGKVIAIIEGSVIIHFVLYYNSTMSDDKIERLVREAVADGKIGSYEVDPNSLKQPPAPTTPEKKGLQVEIIVLIAVIASILVIVIIVVIIWKVKTRRCRRERKVTNREEHKLGERHLSNPSVGYSNSTFGHAPYVEDGPTVTRHQDKRSKEGKKPVPLYSEVNMSKKSKKKKPGEVLYADLDTFQPNVATEGSNAQQPSKKPEKHQTTDYASITDVIKEEGGKSVKVPIVTSDRNISNNGSTISEP